MVWLPDGENTLVICLFVLTEFTNVTDTHTDRHTDIHTAWRHRPRLHIIARQSWQKSRDVWLTATAQCSTSPDRYGLKLFSSARIRQPVWLSLVAIHVPHAGVEPSNAHIHWSCSKTRRERAICSQLSI